jgi:hypothetical protein
MFGSAVPFNNSFFGFLNRGAKAAMVSHIDNVNVTVIATTPTTNREAKRIPHIIRLEMGCGGKPQVLNSRRPRLIENKFDTVEKSFNWTPSCGDLQLEIVVAGTHLVKRYPAPFGFFTFLGEFRGGSRTFWASEFPNESADLKQLGITQINVKFRIRGAPDLDAPSSVPTNIVDGWGS